MQSIICALSCVAIAGLAANATAAVPTFSVQDVGTLGTGRDSSGAGVNGLGHVVGESRTAPTALFHAFISRDGVLTDLGTLGGIQSNALGVNGSDQVVGDADIFNPFGEQHHAFLWQNDEMQDLGTLGGLESVATAINDSGAVVGFSDLAGGGSHAFEWKGGLMADLGALPGDTFSGAAAINSQGVIVGASTAVNQSHAFVYRNGVMRGLPELGDNASANGINDRGQIIATSFYYTDIACTRCCGATAPSPISGGCRTARTAMLMASTTPARWSASASSNATGSSSITPCCGCAGTCSISTGSSRRTAAGS
jgi:probable HAF family extracellular repeat protein